MERPIKVEELDTTETEKVIAELITEDPSIATHFKASFFEKLEALNGRR